MIKVAVTGNMGSGKSTICKVFEVLGIPVFYADLEAKKLYLRTHVKDRIVAELGTQILNPGKEIDFKALSRVIFSNPQSLQFVNSIIHPMVHEEYLIWAEKQPTPYTIREAALIFESGSYKSFDQIIVVHAPEKMLVERIIQRDGSSEEEALARLARQLPQAEKIARSDHSICNDSRQLVLPQVLAIHKNLKNLAELRSNQ